MTARRSFLTLIDTPDDDYVITIHELSRKKILSKIFDDAAADIERNLPKMQGTPLTIEAVRAYVHRNDQIINPNEVQQFKEAEIYEKALQLQQEIKRLFDAASVKSLIPRDETHLIELHVVSQIAHVEKDQNLLAELYPVIESAINKGLKENGFSLKLF